MGVAVLLVVVMIWEFNENMTGSSYSCQGLLCQVLSVRFLLFLLEVLWFWSFDCNCVFGKGRRGFIYSSFSRALEERNAK